MNLHVIVTFLLTIGLFAVIAWMAIAFVIAATGG